MTADAPGISVEKNYPAAFSEYRGRKNAYWFAMALFIFSGAIIGAPLYALLQSPIPFLAVCAVAALPWCFAHFRLSRWFCPRCGRFFHTNGYWKTCSHAAASTAAYTFESNRNELRSER